MIRIPAKIFFLLLILLILQGCKVFNPAPTGTKKVKGEKNLYLDKHEISNLSWKEYLYWLKRVYGQTSAEYLSAFPDSASWSVNYSGNILNDREFDDCPVTGISYHKALEYCRWRSMLVSEKIGKKVVYSLPSAEEYQSSLKILKRFYGARCAKGMEIPGMNSGNLLKVREMTGKPGIAIKSLNISSPPEIYPYLGPEHSLGFRCKAEFR